MEKLVCIANSFSSFLPNRLVFVAKGEAPAPTPPEGAKPEGKVGQGLDATDRLIREAAAAAGKSGANKVDRVAFDWNEGSTVVGKPPRVERIAFGEDEGSTVVGKPPRVERIAFGEDEGSTVIGKPLQRVAKAPKPDVGMATARSPLIERGERAATVDKKGPVNFKAKAEKTPDYDTRPAEVRANTMRTYLQNRKIDPQNFLAALHKLDPLGDQARAINFDTDNDSLVALVERVQRALGVKVVDGIYGQKTDNALKHHAEAYALLLGKKPAEKSAAQPAKPEAKKEAVTLERKKVWETTVKIEGVRVADGGKETLPSGRQVYVESMAPHGESAIVVTADGLRLKIPTGVGADKTLKHVTDTNDMFIDIYAMNIRNEGKDVKIV